MGGGSPEPPPLAAHAPIAHLTPLSAIPPRPLRRTRAALRHSRAPSVVPAQAGTTRSPPLRPRPARRRRSNIAWAARRNVAARSGAGGRLASCLRRNDGGGARMTERGAEMTERGVVRAIGAQRDWCAGSRRSTPHLTSPLEGGRDELGKWGRVLGGWLVPACAGTTERGAARAIEAQRDWCAGSRRSTPHLTPPLEGGRDELGKWGRVLGGWWARRDTYGERVAGAWSSVLRPQQAIVPSVLIPQV